MPTVIGKSPEASVVRDNLLFVGSNLAPFLRWYILENGLMRQLPTPAEPPVGTVRGISVSRDGKLLAVAHDSGGTSNNLTVYAVDGVKSLRKTPYSFSTAVGNGQSVCFDATGKFLAVGLAVLPWLRVFRLNDNLTTSVCSGLNTLTARALTVAFSPDSTALAVGFDVNSGEALRLWTRTSETATSFTERALSNKSIVVQAWGATWPSNDYLVFSSSSNDLTTAIQGFMRSGTTFSRSETLSNTTTANCRKVAMTPGGGLLAFGLAGAPWLQQYTLKGTNFQRVSVGNPAGESIHPPLTGGIFHCKFSRDGRFLAAGGADGFKVYANTYPVSGAMITIPQSVIGTTTDAAWWPRAEDLF